MTRIVLLFLYISTAVLGQSKSITEFRSDFKESNNLFFYSSTMRMLNPNNNPEFAGMLDGIEEIRILNYNKTDRKFENEDVTDLKKNLQKEGYNYLMMISEKGGGIELYSREKRGKMRGLVALVENAETLLLIDMTGSINVENFIKLKQNLDLKL